ncbi:HlyD family efflux transporter periplasmic adaptor subunit [Asinibacterium sp. OR53]|uniref:HlyD family efflux transporter periplasmic adaptor subunit n=1 Tax=Asinibacterium sp. OR53 TaxID=925409 RepID=UPI0018DD8F47|nr:HlyD family efflux transporter periplasmic adaptor subunit [Asinibacterium sp. OR53]
MVAIAVLPLVRVDITVKAQGMIRPATARAEVKIPATGIIAEIRCREGDLVEKGTVLMRLKDSTLQSKKIRNQFEMHKRQQHIQDLLLLTAPEVDSACLQQQLYLPLYREQYNRFRNRLVIHELAVKQAAHALQSHSSLVKERITAPNAFYEMQIQLKEKEAAYRLARNEQLGYWQEALERNRMELAQCEEQAAQLAAYEALLLVRSPVKGFVQGIGQWHTGAFATAGEAACLVSPTDTLMGECYVPSKDIGLIKDSMNVICSFDAFEQRYFGTVSGRVIAIDDDFSLVNGRPLFRVRCSFQTTRLGLKKGYEVALKKGLGFQARFKVTERSLWQLLLDHMDDWLNPSV